MYGFIGMKRGTDFILERHEVLLTSVFIAAGYNLVVCGHSLGAGTRHPAETPYSKHWP